ncbi:putative ABC transport system permease protein [Thermocatellispora tengchongensis]|uniref:Putative ABC transport system permease protein n=2 Tax=Thermocatellispora tengchongensis TaxID=1073253 RepID=A0A840P2K6_9ACTN|nr:ABC transporter permease [Thermocatellispora tengchongensis]MBB5132121.1 putative ABC transport system permease protein [Thermocatellispora tengchongensis]
MEAPPSRLRPADVLRVGLAGVRVRRLRAVLAALGIAIGIATMLAVVGISSSSQADLLRRLDELGTNMLTVKAGQTLLGEDSKLPRSSVAMVGRIESVYAVAATGDVAADVYRTDRIPAGHTGGISVRAATLGLLSTVRGELRTGRWFTAATERYPTVVLGDLAAARLGVRQAGGQVWLGGRWFTVLGVLEPVPLAPGIDRAALVGWSAATALLGFDGHPTTVYERSIPEEVEAVRAVLPRTVNPENPEEVTVSRPSDALAARAATAGAFTNLLLGLGAVALLVGGVGVANTMVVSVLERRGEIGLRRALGATRGHIRTQFLTESLLLSGLGGLAGLALGVTVTLGHALANGFAAVLPMWAVAGGLGATVVIGCLAGLYPAVRASRLSPAVALGAA